MDKNLPEYNTALPQLVIPEYGRNIQRMIDFACSVEDREERNKVAKAIIQVMGQLNPHLRDVTDFKHKLWDHLFIISNFKLDVDSPFPKPSTDILKTKPERLEYPKGNIRYKHYGKTLEAIIAKAKAMEDGEMKTYLIQNIANNLKKAYLTWNRDSVDDIVILQHLEELSGGALKFGDTQRLSSTSDILARNRPKKQFEKNDGKRNHGHGHGHRNNNNKFRKNFRRDH